MSYTHIIEQIIILTIDEYNIIIYCIYDTKCYAIFVYNACDNNDLTEQRIVSTNTIYIYMRPITVLKKL